MGTVTGTFTAFMELQFRVPRAKLPKGGTRARGVLMAFCVGSHQSPTVCPHTVWVRSGSAMDLPSEIVEIAAAIGAGPHMDLHCAGVWL